jgi:hypothetical protein
MDTSCKEKGEQGIVQSEKPSVLCRMGKGWRHVGQTPIPHGVVRVDVGVDDCLDSQCLKTMPTGNMEWGIYDEALTGSIITDDVAQEVEALGCDLLNSEHGNP